MTTGYAPRWSPRPRWDESPGFVRQWAEAVLGAPVIAARDVTGGFSAGVASRLTGANGDRIFVKAVTADLNPFSPRMLRREIRIGPGLAATAAAAPRFRGGLDTDGWVAAAFDDIDGTTPPWPWTEPDAERMLSALAELHRNLTPAPPIKVPPAEHALRGEIGAWARLATVPADELGVIDPWLVEHRAGLTARSSAVDVSGDTLLNLDVRADNTVFDRAGRVWFVDWPWASRGAPTVDVVVLLINFAVAGLDPQRWLAGSHVADTDLVTDLLCVLTGMWAEGLLRPEPPGASGIREFQQAHLAAATAWLRRRMDPASGAGR